ncbi:uncharacterized protein LOC110950047 isoform X2 [Acanthochromis polyacanthus]|uniref:uncharacterized protein LOC110950047 isoform X2 n=1 Tax=Acanthochromis polyacanthus TaxID=80966 RepID=UPI002233E912|nr:uncharacterized protein LOC110950047 isoform X2 [Acanthochromis polyacanthus]
MALWRHVDGGNVFSWGMGQEGQLGLGEDRLHISAPCLVSYSQLTEVTQIQAVDSYSAAVTAGGELLLWGQIPCVSRVSYHTGLKRLWTPQSVPLAGRKVIDVACGTRHMMALTTRSREKNRHYSHQETEAHFRDLVSNPVPTEKENTVKDSSQVQHKLLQGLETPEGTEEQKTDEERKSAEEEERHEQKPNTDERDIALRDAAFAIARSAAGMHRTRNDHSSIRSGQGDDREDCRTAGPWELRNRPLISRRSSRDVVFTTLHLLPRSGLERCRPSGPTLPQLLTAQAQSRVLAGARKDGSANLSQLVQKSGSDSSILHFPRPTPRPPERCTNPEVQKVDSCQQSRIRVHGGRKSSIYNSSPKLSPGQQAQRASPSSHQGPRVRTSFSPTSSSSEPFN